MDGENTNSKKLYLPVQTPDYDAYISGIGKMELIIISLSSLFFILLGIGLSQKMGILPAVFISLSAITIIFLTVRRDNYNENLIDKIKIIVNFQKSNRVYEYEYSNIYEIPLREDLEKEGIENE